MTRLDFDHSAGAHCGSTSLRDLSMYYDWGFDEATCFGLGEGIGFTYLELPESPHRAIFGRTGWLEEVFFENLGIEYAVHEGEAFPDAWQSIKARIDDGDPVMIFVDLFYLAYYETDTHFAPHVLLVVGYEDGGAGEEERVYLADSEFEAIQTLPISQLEQALTSKHVVPLQCRYQTIENPTQRVSFETAAANAIRETATALLDPDASERHSKYFTEQGIEQIEAFAADLPAWLDLPDPAWTARFAYQNIERRGTGGGAFRELYADFLETASSVVSMPATAPEQMREIADGWRSVSETLYTASETENPDALRGVLEKAQREANQLANQERRFYEELRVAIR